MYAMPILHKSKTHDRVPGMSGRSIKADQRFRISLHRETLRPDHHRQLVFIYLILGS